MLVQVPNTSDAIDDRGRVYKASLYMRRLVTRACVCAARCVCVCFRYCTYIAMSKLQVIGIKIISLLLLPRSCVTVANGVCMLVMECASHGVLMLFQVFNVYISGHYHCSLRYSHLLHFSQEVGRM